MAFKHLTASHASVPPPFSRKRPMRDPDFDGDSDGDDNHASKRTPAATEEGLGNCPRCGEPLTAATVESHFNACINPAGASNETRTGSMAPPVTLPFVSAFASVFAPSSASAFALPVAAPKAPADATTVAAAVPPNKYSTRRARSTRRNSRRGFWLCTTAQQPGDLELPPYCERRHLLA